MGNGQTFDGGGAPTVRSPSARRRCLNALKGEAPLDRILHLIVEDIEAAVPGSVGAILRLDATAGTLDPAASPGLPTRFVSAITGLVIGPEAGACGAAAFKCHRVITADIATDPAWATLRGAALSGGLRACWSEPLLDGAGAALGTLALYRRQPGHPDPAALESLEDAASLAALAITLRTRDEAIRRQAELLKAGERLSGLGSFSYDMHSGRWTVSDTWAHLIGTSKRELTVEETRALIHPDDRARLDTVFAALLSGRRQNYDARLIHQQTGAVLHVRCYAEPVLDSDGQPLRIVGAVQDVTEQTLATRALEASEARFHSLFDALPLSIALWRRSGDDFVLEGVNPASESLTHGRITAFLGSRLSTFYADMPWFIAAVRRCAADNRVEETERAYVLRSTGEMVYLDLKFTPVPPDMVMVIAEDIATRKAIEDQLRETASLLSDAELLAGVGSWEWDVLSDTFTVSDNWCRLHGVSRAPSTLDSLLRTIHPDDRPRVEGALRGGLRGEACDTEHRIIHQASGEERHLKTIGSPVGDDSGTVVKVRGVVLDITRKKEQDRALADHILHLSLAERIAGIGSWTYDPVVGIPRWSPEVYRIYERDPALGPLRLSDYDALYSGDTLRVVQTALNGAVRDGRPYEITIPFETPDGRTKWLHALGQPDPTPGPAGHVVHGTLQDITERKRAEEFRDDVERIIRHDLRSPVTATIAGVNILRMSGGLTQDQTCTLDMMERALHRQLSILDISMTLHRMEAGTYELESAAVDIDSVLAEVRDELSFTAQTCQADVQLLGETGVTALGDTWLCRTIVSNLVRNALEALPDAGQTVTVTVATEAGQAVIRVTNPGTVPESIRTRFFEKFVTAGKSGGTGLGTYSARMMARAQKGSVALDTSAPGMTTVLVRLPRP